jgi:hypothetical protein
MSNLLQITDFQVRITNGKTYCKPVEELSWLSRCIDRYGRDSIACITFYFRMPRHKMYYICLRANDDSRKFHVEFNHYYNEREEKVNSSFQNKLRDFNSLMVAINQTGNLNDTLGYWIINPFQNEQNV